MVYIATFYTHYDAMTFCKKLCSSDIPAKMMPVPRRISSSCGTGVRFETEQNAVLLCKEHVEKLFRYDAQADCYELLYFSE